VTIVDCNAQPRVLWIDGDLAALSLFERVLGREGITVDCALAGRNGLDRARSGFYDLVGLDLTLPDIDGLEILTTLRGGGHDVPVCIVTGQFGDEARIAAALSAGGTSCFPKPVRTAQLVEMVHHTAVGGTASRWIERLSRVHALLRALDSELRAGAGCLDGMPGLQLRLAQVAIRLSTTISLFRACGYALRDTIQSKSWPDACAVVEARLKRVRECSNDAEASVEVAIARLEHDTSSRLPTEAELGRAVGISASALGRRLHDITGLDYRSFLRLVALRRTTRRLITARNEHIQQVAVVTGWSSHNRFDREFHNLFGLTPREFRRLVASASTKAHSATSSQEITS
jgi:CheY-like chemotaxis protein